MRFALYWPVFLAGVWLARHPIPSVSRPKASILVLLAVLVWMLDLSSYGATTLVHFGLRLAFGLLLLVPLHRLAQALESMSSLSVLDVFAGPPTYYMFLYHRVVYAVILLLLGAAASEKMIFASLLLLGIPCTVAVATGAAYLGQRWHARTAAAKLRARQSG